MVDLGLDSRITPLIIIDDYAFLMGFSIYDTILSLPFRYAHRQTATALQVAVSDNRLAKPACGPEPKSALVAPTVDSR